MHLRSILQYSAAARSNVVLFIVVFALVILRTFVITITEISELQISGDGPGYISVAEFILEEARLPELSNQSKGFSIFLAVFIAIWEDWAQSYENAAVIMDVVLLIVIAYSAILFLKSRAITFVVLSLIFIQPFTISYIRYLYPDHTCQFFLFLGATLTYLAFFWYCSSILLLLGGVLLGISGVIRQDILPLSVFIICSTVSLAWMRQALDRRYLLQSAIVALAVSAALPSAALVWQAQSSGEIGFSRSSVTSNPGVLFAGYSKWLRSWVIFERSEHNRFAWSMGSESWPGFAIQKYPDRAFASDDHRTRASTLLTSWKEQGYSDKIDTQFRQLAIENCADFIGRCYIALPLARMAVLWVNLDGAHTFIAPLEIQRPLSTVVVLLVLCLRLSVLLFAAFAAWKLLDQSFQKDMRFPLVAIGFSVVALRTIEIGVLGISSTGISWGGLVEARYMTPVFPFMIVIAVLGVSIFLNDYRAKCSESG